MSPPQQVVTCRATQIRLVILNWYTMSPVATLLPILVLLWLWFVELWANTRQTDNVTLSPWPLTFEVTTHVGHAGDRTQSVSSFKVCRPYHAKIWLIFSHGVKQSGDLDLWPLRSLCMSMILVMVLHLYTKFEISWPSRSKSLIGLVTLTLWPLNGLAGYPCHGLPSCHFSAFHAFLHVF